jgi:hypothetical protein
MKQLPEPKISDFFNDILQICNLIVNKKAGCHFPERVLLFKNIFLLFLLFLSFTGNTQDYAKLTREMQQKYKESEVAIVSSNTSFDFQKSNSKSLVRIFEDRNEKLLSLRYNHPLLYVETEIGETTIEEFSAVSNLKQKAPDELRVCGKYTQDGLFYDDSRVCVQTLQLKELGELWDVTLRRKINDGKYLTSVYFEEKYPLISKKISFKIPIDIEIEIKEFNFGGYNIVRTEKIKGNIKLIEYECRDLPALETASLARGIQYNHPHLLVLLKSVETNGRKTTILSSTKDLYSWYHSLTKQLLPKPDVFKPLVAQLIKDKTTDEEKIKAIYYWVQNNIRYIAFEDGIAGFKPDEAQNVYEKKYGDCKGMANLTKEMLKVAGFDARLTWIGTKKIMYDYSLPSLAVDNHMICTVLLKGKKYFLDATEKYIPLGCNAERIQNRQALIEDGDNFILDYIPESQKNSNLELKELKLTLDKEQLSGTCQLIIKGEPKKDFLYAYHYTKNEKKDVFISRYLSNYDNSIKISAIEVPDLEERGGDLSIKCHYNSTEGISSFNNEYYIDIDDEKNFKDFDIKKDRQSDIDFGEKIHKKSIIELSIPQGYKVAHLPENLNISHPEFSFNINYKLVGNKIIYTKEIGIEKGIIQKSSFDKWNSSLKELSKFYENQITLSK